MTPTETQYRCTDGTPFPVTWNEPGDERLAWAWNQSHFPAPLTPLQVAARRVGQAGVERAFTEAGLLPLPPQTRRHLYPAGFQYICASRLPPDEQPQFDAAVGRLVERCGGEWSVWVAWCLPRLQEACRALQEERGDLAFAALAETGSYALQMTMVSGQTVQALFGRVAAFLSDALGTDAQHLVAELTQGYPNATVALDQELWEVAQLAARSPATRRALLESEPDEAVDAVRAADDADVLAAFDGLLDRHHRRSEGWDLILPTWGERPATPLAHIRRLLACDAPSPALATAAAARRRESSRREIESRLAGDGDALARFRSLSAPLAHYVAIREGRAYWQLIGAGSLRGALLRRGRRLVETGRLRAAEDVLFLMPEEMESAAGDLDERAGERRAARAAWLDKEPPAGIGAPIPPGSPFAPAPASATPGVITGIPASAGIVTGRARVLADHAAGERLEPGEILVCVMTTPDWTPLFAIAGGVVTESGGLLSHPAITAREYGIPCVVGARGAMRAIATGALITVDGGAGTVHTGGMP